MSDLKQRFGSTALITGASSGIGEAYAKALAANKIDLVLVARRQERLNKLKQELEKAHGISVTVLAHDLSLPQSAGDVYSALSQAGIQVDILINNAGFGSTGMFQELPRERELAMSDLRQQVADLSLTISEKVIGEALDEQTQRKLIAGFLEQTEGLK